MNLNMPTLRIELEGLKHSVQGMFNQNNKALNTMIIKTLEKTLTEEWVQEQVTEAVKACIEKSIKEVSSNWKLQAAISGLISENIKSLISNDK